MRAPTDSTGCIITIPCYNEAARLESDRFLRYLREHTSTKFIFVNDGSTDQTGLLLEQMCSELPGQIAVLQLQKNVGKAEAVRSGLLHALRSNSGGYVGFWDADLATPLEAIGDLLDVFANQPEVDFVLAARVKLLGRKIERQRFRHYLGRIFATCASLVLELPIYDTQCGAKLFRVTSVLPHLLAEPFCSRWIFDVELIARFLQTYSADNKALPNFLYEFPLHCWTDIGGSKVRPTDFVKAANELLIIRRRYKLRRSTVTEQ